MTRASPTDWREFSPCPPIACETANVLITLARRVERLCPSRRDPESFWQDKRRSSARCTGWRGRLRDEGQGG